MQLKRHADITANDLARIETPFFARDLVEDALTGLALEPIFGLSDILDEQFPNLQTPKQDPFVIDQLLAQIDEARLLLLYDLGESPFVPLFFKRQNDQGQESWQLNEPLSPEARFCAQGLLSRPAKAYATDEKMAQETPFTETCEEESWLDRLNDRWAAKEKESSVFDLTMGRQSLPGNIHTVSTGIQEIVSASRGLAYVNRPGFKSNIAHVSKSPDARRFAYIIANPDSATHTKAAVQLKYAENSGKGHYQIWKHSELLKHTASNLKSAGSSGAAWAVPLSIVGTTLQYAIDNEKEFYSKAFAKDVGLDSAKGIISGGIAAATATGTSVAITAVTAATIGSVIPVVGTIVGFGLGAVVGFLVSYRVEGIYQEYNLR